MPDDPRLVRLARLAKLRALRAQAVPRPSEFADVQAGASTTAPQPANAPALAGAMFGDADLQDAAKDFGLPQGEPGAVDTRAVQGAIRRANVAAGVEAPRLTERLVKAAGLDPGTAAAVTGLENAVRGLPSGAVQGILGGTADAVKAGGILLDPFRALGELAAGQRPSALQASDLLRDQVEAPAVNAIRNVTRPEGTGGMIGEQVGALATQAGAAKALEALSALRATREAAKAAEASRTLTDATMDRIGGASADVQAADRLARTRAAYEARTAADQAAAERMAAVEARRATHPMTVGPEQPSRHTGKPIVTPPPVQPRGLLAAGPPVVPEVPAAVSVAGDAFAGVPDRPVPQRASLTEARPVATVRRAEVRGREVWLGGNAKYRFTDDADLYARRQDLLDRLDASQQQIGEGVTPFARDNGYGVVSGTSVNASAGRAIGALKRDTRLLDELETELAARGHGPADIETFAGRLQQRRMIAADAERGGVADLADLADAPKAPRPLSRARAGIRPISDPVTGATLQPGGVFDVERTAGPTVGWQVVNAEGQVVRRFRTQAEVNGFMERVAAPPKPTIAPLTAAEQDALAAPQRRADAALEREAIQGEGRVPAAAMRFLPDEFGGISPRALTTLGGAGTGAATGAATDKDHPLRGAVLGGLAGAALGAAVGGKLGRRGGVAVEPEPVTVTTQQAIDDLLASVKPVTAKMKQAEAGLGGIPQGAARAEADQFVNVAKFSFTDPSGEARLRQTVSRLAEGKDALPKPVVTWDEAKAQAAKLGLNPEALSRKKVDRLRGPDLLAIRNIVSDNIEAMETAARKLSTDGTLTDLERRRLMAQMNALDTQNMALLDKFTEARTRAGRDLNNLKIVAMRTNDPILWLAKARQWAGKDLEPTTRDLIVQLAREGKVQDYLALMGTLRKAGPLEKLATFFKANLLTNPLTHIVNTTSNVQLAGLEVAKDVPGAAFDRLLSLATKRRTLTAPTVRQLRAGLAGAKQGLREAGQVMRGIPLDEALEKFDFPRETQYTSPVVGKLLTAYTRTPFRALGAADRVFKTAALRYSLANQAEARGLNVAATLADPPEDMMVQAILDAAQATVQDKTKIGDLLKAVSQAGGGAGQFVVPFSRTPGAVATRVAEYTPIGGIMGGVKAVKVVRAALKGAELSVAEQREAAKLLGRATTGSGILALGYWLASKGLASGTTGRGDTGQRDTNYLTGRPDNALKVGKTWLALGRLSPAGMLLAVGANLYDVDRGGTTPLDAAGGMAGTIAQAVTDQPFLTGISNALELAQNPKKASTYGKLASDIATGFLPASAALGAVARGTDASVRDPKTLGEKIQSRIPGAAEQLPVMLDQFGRAVPREGGLTDAMLNPLKRTTDQTNDPALREIARLGITISRRRPSGTRDRDATRTLTAYEGPAIQKRLERIVADPRYAALDDTQRKYVLERAILRTRAEATRRLKAVR